MVVPKSEDTSPHHLGSDFTTESLNSRKLVGVQPIDPDRVLVGDHLLQARDERNQLSRTASDLEDRLLHAVTETFAHLGDSPQSSFAFPVLSADVVGKDARDCHTRLHGR